MQVTLVQHSIDKVPISGSLKNLWMYVIPDSSLLLIHFTLLIGNHPAVAISEQLPSVIFINLEKVNGIPGGC